MGVAGWTGQRRRRLSDCVVRPDGGLVAVARWLEGHGATLGAWVLAPGMAVSSIGATVLGEGAFLWSAAAPVPVLVPVAPARWRLSGAWRALPWQRGASSPWCCWAEVPSAYGALTPDRRSVPAPCRNARAPTSRLGCGSSARCPARRRRPSPARHHAGRLARRHRPASRTGRRGRDPGALDSMARSIAARRDSLVLVVTLDMDRGVNQPASDDDAWMRERIALIVHHSFSFTVAAASASMVNGRQKIPWWRIKLPGRFIERVNQQSSHACILGYCDCPPGRHP